jgi:ERCC4-related helicase
MEPKYRVDDEVRLLSQPDRAGRVTASATKVQREYWYSIYFGPGQRGRHPESDLEPYTQTFDVRKLVADGRFAGHEAFVKRITYLKLAQSLRSHIYALQASRTTFYSYQFKPVLKFLDSWKHRLLIADEVGLGKTIEAGLILTELRARLDLQRVLIVAPSHLLTKWQTELRTRFALDFEILDRARALELLTKVEREGDDVRTRSIISLQSLRGRALQERWEAVAPTFDVVIVDEAGRLRNPGTQSHQAARLVAEAADAVLLLTATPTQTREYDLFALLSLLDPDDFSDFGLYSQRLSTNQHILNAMRLVRGGRPEHLNEALDELAAAERSAYGPQLAKNDLFIDIRTRLATVQPRSRKELVELQRDLNALNLFGHIMSRTRRVEVDEQRPLRSAHTVLCQPSAIEVQFYDQVTSLCRAAYKQASGSSVAAFAVMMPQRQMASCMPAMVHYLRDRLAKGELAIVAPEQSDLRVEDFDEDEAGDASHKPKGPDWKSLGDLDTLAQQLRENDSKWKQFHQVLRNIEREQPGAKIVVFSFFKRTLAYLRERMEEHGIKAELISGDVPSVPTDPENDERAKRLARFRNERSVRVLLSTEVGNEGLDMQFSHVLVNYDLPWNPMTVEQRIGRLDRIGQRSDRIHIYNLSMPGTIEDVVLERLYLRIRIFEQSIGDLEQILGEVLRELTLDLFSPELSPAQQEARIIQAADAVEQKRLEQAALESRVASLIGHDEFFADEIARVKDSRRYITSDELLLIVKDFLVKHHPQCEFSQREADGWTITITESLRWFIRSSLGIDDSGWLEFQRRTGRGVLELTTDAQQAQERASLDLLTFYHPLVRAVAKYYSQNATELHPVSALRVVSRMLPAGHYVWGVCLTEVTGARPVKELDFVLVDGRAGTVIDIDTSDAVFWLMLSQGSSVPVGEEPTVAHEIARLVEVIEGTGIERLNERFLERNRLNNATVDARLASLEAAHARNLATRDERLQLAYSRNRTPQYLRMLEGGIRKLKSAYEMKRTELDAQRTLGRSISLEAAGVVEVVHV